MKTLCPLEATNSNFLGILPLRAFPADGCAGWDSGLILEMSEGTVVWFMLCLPQAGGCAICDHSAVGPVPESIPNSSG